MRLPGTGPGRRRGGEAEGAPPGSAETPWTGGDLIEAAPSSPARRPAALDESLVVGAHRVLLRRDPDHRERTGWIDRLQAGLGIEEMLAALLDSEEFLARHHELRRRAGLAADDRERLAIARRLAALEDRVEALTRAAEAGGGPGGALPKPAG